MRGFVLGGMDSRYFFQRSNFFLGLGALLLVGLTAWLGLKGVDAESARVAIERGGYWHAWVVLILFGSLAASGWRRRMTWFFGRRKYCDRSWLGLGAFLLGATLWLHLHQPHEFKVHADEVNLLNVSQAMYEHRYVYSPGRAAMQDGVVIAEAGHLDKRPYFFSFLVSLLHDATGYRPLNPLVLNGLLTLALVAGVWALGRRLDKRSGGAVAVLALSLTPIVAHVATSAGFELYNLTLLAWTWLLCLRAWDRPTNRRMGLAAIATVALAMGRYESLLYAVPAACVLLAAMGKMSRAGRLPSKWFVAAPLLFLPALLLIHVSFSNEATYFQWQARGEEGTFSLRYFGGNLWSAVDFFFFPHPLAMGAPLVFLAGLLGWVLMLRPSARRGCPMASRDRKSTRLNSSHRCFRP